MRQGFTLLETMVAVSILVMAVTGPLTLASRSLHVASKSENRITVSALIQEGLELVYARRTSNVLGGQGWNRGFSGCESPSGCMVDILDLNFSPCGGGGCPPILFDGALFQYESGSATIFTRKINIDSSGGSQMKVDVQVSWNEEVGVKSITVSEYLFDWQ